MREGWLTEHLATKQIEEANISITVDFEWMNEKDNVFDSIVYTIDLFETHWILVTV